MTDLIDQRVIPMASRLTAAQSAELLVESLHSALRGLEEISDAPLNADALERLDDIDTRMSLLLARLRCKRSIVHLVSQFGRAP